jgi:outer membrane receptor protein involved in Fe transport
MRKIASYVVTFLLANVITIAAFAQNVAVSGNVRNSSTKEGAGAVSVTVKDGTAGTFTDDKGNFKITVKSLPVTLLISSVGYELQEVTVSSALFTQVEFKPSAALGQEVVVSATRVPQRIMESPVSIERVSAANIRNAPAANFYDVVAALKGVDVTTSSLTFKTPTTRGFNSSGNTRFNQLVDGMDNQAPGLNFSVGAIIGLSELDVDNIELLSGASSALYGPGGMNGTLLMTSKNPFKYQGLSFLVKTGIMNTDGRQNAASAYHNWNLRWGKKVSEKFAFKINAEMIQAKDWIGTDARNYIRSGTGGTLVAGDRKTDPNYDGVNVYGDENPNIADIRGLVNGIGQVLIVNGLATQSFINTLLVNPIKVSRTGYTEKELVNPNTINFKLAGSLHYKLTTNTEAVLAAYWGTGNTVYTGSERYSLKDFKMGQYKFELNNKNWMLRAYTTQENAGESFNVTATTLRFNEAWKPTVTFTNGVATPQPTDWLVQYTQSYLGKLLGGGSNIDAHNFARSIADIGRPAPGTAAFKSLFDAIRTKPISQNGGLLLDKSDLYAVEGNYNFTHLTKDFADILIGANYKQYVLNSQGTLFADSVSPIKISEYGAYIQATRKITNGIKLTASARYDKNQNFEGRFTPRVTALFKVAENNNVRLSYQSAYRFPSNQMQYINLPVGSTRLVGSDPTFGSWLGIASNPLYTASSLAAGSPKIIVPGQVKPEAVNSFELGYKGLLMENKFLIDVYGYYGQYQDFLSRTNTVQALGSITDPASPKRNISIPINAPEKVKTYGFGFSIDYRLPLNFTIGGNVASDVLKDVPADFTAYFNAPKYKANASFGNTGFGPEKRLGFNVAYRWQQSFFYQGDFANGQLPDVHTLDGQISVKLPKTKSILKLGANNLLNQYYYNAIGNSQIGGLYYVSFGYNIY